MMPNNFARYRWRLLVLLLVAICTLAAVSLQTRVKFKTPFTNQSDLDTHIISDLLISDLPKNVSAPVIVVGSSESTGLNGFLNSKLQVRNVYDLSTARGNLMTSMAVTALARPYHPKVIVLAWAENSMMDANLLWSNVVTSQPDVLRNYVPEDLLKEIRTANSLPVRFFNTVSKWLNPLGVFSVNATGVMSLLRDRLYQKRIEGKAAIDIDPYSTGVEANNHVVSLKRFKTDLIRGFKNLANDEGAQLIVYIAPTPVQSGSDEAKQRDRKLAYEDSMENLRQFKAENIEVHDYFELFSDKSSLFKDPSHLSRKGLELFSERIYSDLVASHCATEIAAACPAGKTEDLENCLWEKAESLSPSCRWLRPSICRADKQKFCNDLSDEQLDQCMREHYHQLTTDCRKFHDPCEADLSSVSRGMSANERENYLWKNYDRLSPECKELRRPYYEKDPCLVDIHRLCKSVSTQENDDCLRAHFNELTPQCRERRDPCDADLSAASKKLNADERSTYLWAHYQTLSPECKSRHDPYFRLNPCIADQAKLCGSLASDPNDECLTKHYAELTPECQARRNPCDADFASLCTNVKQEKRENCLWANFEKLTPACAGLMRPQYKLDPCRVDLEKFCDPMNPELQDDCLRSHYAELTPDCKARRDPCDADLTTYCQGTEKEKGTNCLFAHYPTLSTACRALLQPSYRLDPCKVDFQKFCGTLPPYSYGDCLKSHYANLSAECQERYGPL